MTVQHDTGEHDTGEHDTGEHDTGEHDTGDPGDAEPVVRLTRWTGPWPQDDKDANLKEDIALYMKVDPLRTVRGLSADVNVPEGAIVRYVLARWASEGASGLLELGPTLTRRLHAVCAAAEAEGDDAARLAAFHQLRQVLAWLQYPLDHPEVYDR